MKRFIILSIFLLSLSCASAQMPNRSLTISHLTGDFYVYTTYGSYNGMLVPANSMYLVTDAGSGFDLKLIHQTAGTSDAQPHPGLRLIGTFQNAVQVADAWA